MLQKIIKQTTLFAILTGMTSALLFGYFATTMIPAPAGESIHVTLGLWFLIGSLVLWTVSGLLGTALLMKKRA